ncbi:MAG: phosphoribosylanthranilate isomerase [Candidatus Atribacteria bacterium]|nr:phosphoribosylanthranilate isomerase [Candidatus Atribacteria bacterium]MCD6349881.1 phosphoribosylanthranilate isomerase [Candidatus Atribacteria bacterium]
MVHIKVCGITLEEDALQIAQTNIWALGFIFVEESPRFINPDKARQIIQNLPVSIIKVGVFRNHSLEDVQFIRSFCSLDLLQLHGEEPPQFCEKLGRGVIKAFGVDVSFDPLLLEDYAKVVDFYLLDSAQKGKSGGLGITFDWDKIKNTKRQVPKPLIVAGGLRKENIVACVRTLQPFAIDLNSGVESAPGKKEAKKLLEIIQILEREVKK